MSVAAAITRALERSVSFCLLCASRWSCPSCLRQPEAELAPALSRLLALEKRTRLAADAFSTAKVAVAILELLFATRSWSLLNDHISLLSKRRAQLQRVQEAVVQTAVAFVPQTPDDEVKRRLIETLRAVSAGKMFVELERARLTRSLAAMEEAAGRQAAAAELMQEVAVETIGTMEAKEKLDFLLEQLRLCLAKRDYVRCEIIAKKVDVKALKEGRELQQEKLRYHRLMLSYHLHFGNYFDVAQAYQQMYLTPAVQADAEQWRRVLRKLVLYSVLSPFDSELSDFTARVSEDKQLQQLPEYRALLTDYLGQEIIAWPLSPQQQKEILSNDAFTDAEEALDGSGGSAMDLSSSSSSSSSPASAPPSEPATAASGSDSVTVHNGAQRLSDFHKRVVQHNMRVIAAYYDRISSQRFASLLQLKAEAAESFLSELVSSGQLQVKIDRPRGEIVFVRGGAGAAGGAAAETAASGSGGSSGAIAELTSNVDALLQIIETTCHLINKEIMTLRPGTAVSASAAVPAPTAAVS